MREIVRTNEVQWQKSIAIIASPALDLEKIASTVQAALAVIASAAEAENLTFNIAIFAAVAALGRLEVIFGPR